MRFGERLWVYPWNIEPEGLPAEAVADATLRLMQVPVATAA